MAVLREAIHFETARRVLTSNMLVDIADNWHKDVRIQKELARFAVSDEIAELAQELVRHESGVYNED